MDEAPWLNEVAIEGGRVVMRRRAPQVVGTWEVAGWGGLALGLCALGFVGHLWASVCAVLVGAWFAARAGLWVIGRRGLYEVTLDLTSGAITLLDVRGLDAPRRALLGPEELATMELSEQGLAIWWLGDEEPAIRGLFAEGAEAWAEAQAALGACAPLGSKITRPGTPKPGPTQSPPF